LREDFATDFLAWLPPRELHDFENQLASEDGSLKSFRSRVHAFIESPLFPRDFVLRCMLEGLDVVAITDHNTPMSGDVEATGVVRLVPLSGDGVEREFALPRKGTKIDRYTLKMPLREMTGPSALRLPTYYNGDELYEAVYQKPKRGTLRPSAFAAIEHYRGLARGVLRRYLSDEQQSVALEPILRPLESEEIYLVRKGVLLDPRLKRTKDRIHDYDKMRYGEKSVALTLEILTSGFSRDELRETRLPEPLTIDQEDDLFEDKALYQQMLRGLLRRPRQIT